MAIHFNASRYGIPFHSLPLEEAKKVLYTELLLCCESHGIYLCQDGNLNTEEARGRYAKDSTSTRMHFYSPVEEYTYHKDYETLLDVEKVQKVFQVLDRCVKEASTYNPQSLCMKSVVEKELNESISKGDFIAAMLLKGYQARFGCRGDPLKMSCEFRAEEIRKL